MKSSKNSSFVIFGFFLQNVHVLHVSGQWKIGLKWCDKNVNTETRKMQRSNTITLFCATMQRAKNSFCYPAAVQHYAVV